MEGTARHLRPRRTDERERSVTEIKACQMMVKG